MIFGKNAGLMLKYQKAKAKMVEYDVSKQEYPHFPLNSNELSYPTTYVLSRYSECIIENNHDELKELELLLITTAEYYDSAFKSKDRPEYDWDFLLSGASAYFLRKDFGSAKVLAARVVDLIDEERSPQKLLTNIYNYLLGGVYLPYLRVIDTYERINNFFLDYFGKGKSLEALKSNLWVYRNEIYENGDPDSIFYVDILVAVIIVACENSSWSLLPSSSGILDEEWESYLQSKMSIKMLWPAQRLIAELLYVITELYLQICGDFRYQEHIQSICKKWIDGQTPMEINNKETIGIAEVESLCNKRISYEMNFLIGNICDLIEVDGENEEQVDQRNILTLLQKKVKYGVPNMTAISICESVFNDRLLAIELAQILSDANIGTDKILNMLKAHSEEIFSCLDSYPEYFKDRLSVLMK